MNLNTIKQQVTGIRKASRTLENGQAGGSIIEALQLAGFSWPQVDVVGNELAQVGDFSDLTTDEKIVLVDFLAAQVEAGDVTLTMPQERAKTGAAVVDPCTGLFRS